MSDRELRLIRELCRQIASEHDEVKSRELRVILRELIDLQLAETNIRVPFRRTTASGSSRSTEVLGLRDGAIKVLQLPFGILTPFVI